MTSDAMMLVDTGKAVVQKLNHPALEASGLDADILRLDLIHPTISGNKWFKLKLHLQEALDLKKKGIVTFGGAWSNHILATADACKLSNLSSIAFIRGEKPAILSSTLLDCERAGMHLIFVSRTEYTNKTALLNNYADLIQDYHYVPEGGKTIVGVLGSAEILNLLSANIYNYLICAVGTGTMMKGLLSSTVKDQKLIGISSLKIREVSDSDLYKFLLEGSATAFDLRTDFDFGGYGKYNGELIDFMNAFYRHTGVPTDIVYTSKLCYGFINLAQKGYFEKGSKICLIHSGGLQGNRSLPMGILCY